MTALNWMFVTDHARSFLLEDFFSKLIRMEQISRRLLRAYCLTVHGDANLHVHKNGGKAVTYEAPGIVGYSRGVGHTVRRRRGPLKCQAEHSLGDPTALIHLCGAERHGDPCNEGFDHRRCRGRAQEIS